MATFVGIWLLGKVGRRPMLLTGLIGTTSALLLIGIFSNVLQGSAALPYVVLTLTVTFLAFQQGAISPVTWLMLSEIFPLRVRGLGMGVTVFVCGSPISLSDSRFRYCLNRLGCPRHSTFCRTWTSFHCIREKFLPETKGLTLEQLEHNFRNYKSETAQSGASAKSAGDH
ncbi:MFS transporter [Bacillus licheniformis]|nr:MFS transporter [Bacillus licheniformis]